MCCCRLRRQSRKKKEYSMNFSVLQWFVGKRASWHPHCRSYLSVDNTEKRFRDSSSISGYLRLTKDLHQDTKWAVLAVYESKWLMLAFVLYYRRTVEPLWNDHPHQRPSLLYDHISCDGQCFLFVRSLTNDHPSNATNDRVRWNFLPRGRPYRVFQNVCNEYPIEGSTFYI